MPSAQAVQWIMASIVFVEFIHQSPCITITGAKAAQDLILVEQGKQMFLLHLIPTSQAYYSLQLFALLRQCHDPLELGSRPTMVWIDGKRQSLVTRQDRLRDRYLTPTEGALPKAYDR